MQSEHRRRLHNELVDLKGAIRCIARVRPLAEGEDLDGAGAAVQQMLGPGNVALPQVVCFDGLERSFEMDAVLGPQVGMMSSHKYFLICSLCPFSVYIYLALARFQKLYCFRTLSITIHLLLDDVANYTRRPTRKTYMHTCSHSCKVFSTGITYACSPMVRRARERRIQWTAL